MEARPAEAGRNVVVRRAADGSTADVNPPPFNARTRVHEYGGLSYVVAGNVVYFSNYADQRLYRLEPSGQPQPITPEEDRRYADGVYDAGRNRLIYVREDHTQAGREAVNTVVAVDAAAGGAGEVLVEGNDFYAFPRLSPDGSRLAWLAWNHPNMPWDGCELWVAEFAAAGGLQRRQRIAGGPAESIFQPQWSPDGVLYFVSDRSGWWNLYRWQDGQIEPLAPMAAEFGAPLWRLGGSTYAFESAGRMVCSYTRLGRWHLALLDTASKTLETLETSYSTIAEVHAAPGRAWFVAGSPTEPAAVIDFDLASREPRVLRRSSAVEVDPAYVSPAQAVEFPAEGGQTAHAFFYRPANRDFAAPEGDRPPLLVISHGGPTSAARSDLNLEIQYWTSRGIAVLDVNYGGSTGYGRDYRERLNGRWGIVDVDDCVNGALFLVKQGEVDGERLIIRGGSAGGYTTLAALAFRDVFKAGASYYGISDLEAMARDTHKYESRYLDGLVGLYPQQRDVYVERSPLNHVRQLSCPMILLQGLEDKVVPPNQAEMMFEAVRAKELPVAYVPFEGEQHGFRHAKNIKRALDGELYFYSRIFGFQLAEPVEPVLIENLD
jgi:dipeptidyl aminopeptidase/acylaminoacyl peptidase